MLIEYLLFAILNLFLLSFSYVNKFVIALTRKHKVTRAFKT